MCVVKLSLYFITVTTTVAPPYKYVCRYACISNYLQNITCRVFILFPAIQSCLLLYNIFQFLEWHLLKNKLCCHFAWYFSKNFSKELLPAKIRITSSQFATESDNHFRRNHILRGTLDESEIQFTTFLDAQWNHYCITGMMFHQWHFFNLEDLNCTVLFNNVYLSSKLAIECCDHFRRN
jgi:hypothetical protein